MLKITLLNIARQFGYKKGYREFVNKISSDPLNSKIHFQYAVYAFGKKHYYLSIAEIKTAEFLDATDAEVQRYKKIILSKMPRIDIMNHNQYFRLKSLALELRSRNSGGKYSVLDVGGGDGRLASFIPEAYYCLAEPNMNGISGIDLPFPDHSFDYVVSCHVLEHIPVTNRIKFIDQLLSKSKNGIILLNPFHVDKSFTEESEKLVMEITGAEWAKEHLECTLPKIEDIKKYANERGLQINIKPNGTSSTTLALVFADYFFSKSYSKSGWENMNMFLNANFNNERIDSEKYPTAYIVYLGWPEK
ncbi:MAG: Methyltransferase domain-containing protein [Candidatus Electronema aureum]|uniref:Methyltransferase domain-containing protein n=1 Tax=Candidatus Electronema aureum TaxID=2005002 RepID=A0A521G5L0_9BACT|nr:MAG: Methyltransferase domain-containing protein [Candidatus Electronema aureum]